MTERLDPIIIAVAGTGATKKVALDYYEKLVRVSAPDVPSEDKIFALYEGGKGHLQDPYDELEVRISAFRREHIGRKVIALGHSQGGVYAARLGADRYTDSVISMAAPIRGGVTQGLPSFGANKESAKLLERELAADSPFMHALQEDMLAAWPINVPLYIVAATYDAVVPREAQFGAELPAGIKPQEFVVITPSVAMMGEFGVRIATHTPAGVGAIMSDFPVDHFTVPYASGLPRFLGKVVERIS